MKNSSKPIYILLSFVFILFAGSLYQLWAQDEGSKGILPEEAGINNRPPLKFSPNKPSDPRRRTAKPTRKFTYKTAKKFNPVKPSAGQETAQVGVTFWRFRPTRADDKTKELVDDGGDNQPKEFTLERFDTDTPFKIGEKVRIGIESLSRTGYLYVIDRELYQDGTFGPPRLIFPTTRIRGGNNFVKPGNLLYLPSPTRSFRIQQGNPNKPLVSEVLTMIISPQPLGLPEEIGEKAMNIPIELFSKWETEWKTSAIQMDLEDGVGQALSEQEQQAGSIGTKDLIDEDNRLTQSDLPPQTVFRSIIKTTNPFLVTVAMKFGK